MNCEMCKFRLAALKSDGAAHSHDHGHHHHGHGHAHGHDHPMDDPYAEPAQYHDRIWQVP